jgi:hypothetical protein
MGTQPLAAKIGLATGATFIVLGVLLLCHCPGMFVIAAVAFGVGAGFGAGRIRLYSAVLVAFSLAMAYQNHQAGERARENAIEAQRQNGERERLRANQREPEESN